MTDTDREYTLVGDHAENLTSGAMLTPGKRVTSEEMADGDQWLIDEGRLVEIEPTAAPTLKDLQARARDLGIEGRSSKNAEELQAAINEAEAPIIAAAKDGVAESEAREGDA